MGENLKLMREKRELSQSELARIAHISVRTIQVLEGYDFRGDLNERMGE